MKKVKIYQWILSDADRDTINFGKGWEEPIGKLYSEATVFPTAEGVRAAESKYRHTMTAFTPVPPGCDAEDALEYAFEIGNLFPEDRYASFGEHTSASVGNVFEVEGRFFVVMGVGFEEIEAFNPGGDS